MTSLIVLIFSELDHSYHLVNSYPINFVIWLLLL
ncbi:hypothetical protein HMPREF9447_00207 [Bacteroides oleiciplenus YIT 12058]|uniref:Uncharacterized protein n=1 Tax=Bacteroides oleiciplenus YIT 12058 TaxID=742727 RepID=K9ETM8_9BACE|nr:hypothetical protein HMPREF9447_00207 [Bacteroides oleiciplenus YIT 12058]